MTKGYIMENKKTFNTMIEEDIQSDSNVIAVKYNRTYVDYEQIDLKKIILVYGTIFFIGTYNMINAVASMFSLIPQLTALLPAKSSIMKLVAFDFVELILYITISSVCLIAFHAILKGKDCPEIYAISPLILGYSGFTVKSVLYRFFFNAMYKTTWQNNFILASTLIMIAAILIYFKKENIFSVLKKL